MLYFVRLPMRRDLDAQSISFSTGFRRFREGSLKKSRISSNPSLLEKLESMLMLKLKKRKCKERFFPLFCWILIGERKEVKQDEGYVLFMAGFSGSGGDLGVHLTSHFWVRGILDRYEQYDLRSHCGPFRYRVDHSRVLP